MAFTFDPLVDQKTTTITEIMTATSPAAGSDLAVASTVGIPASGYVQIGISAEIIRYSSITDATHIRLAERGALDTTADTHVAGDTIYFDVIVSPHVNELVAKFNATAGHTHSGAVEDAPAAEALLAKGSPHFNVKAYGAVGDGTTDDTVAWQATIDAANAAGGGTVLAIGAFRINTTVYLKSNVFLDLTDATLYGGAGISGLYLFRANGISHWGIKGGHFDVAAFSPMNTIPSGTYVNSAPIYVDGGSSDFHIENAYFYGWMGTVIVYDSFRGWITNTLSVNCDASIAIDANSAETYDIHVVGNKIIGGGDDGIIATSRSNYNIRDIFIVGNRIDKTRLYGGGVGAAVGIRTGQYNAASGKCYNIQILDNVLRDMVTSGIDLEDTYNSIVSRNILDGYSDIASAGIYCGHASHPCDNVEISHNTITNPHSNHNAIALMLTAVTNSVVAHNHLVSNYNGVGTLFMNSGSQYNLVQGNYLENQNTSAALRYQESGTADYIELYGNDAHAEGVASIAFSLAGTHDKLRDNLGWVTRNYGTSAAISSGATIAHGLAATPTTWTVTPTVTGLSSVYATVNAANITVTYTGSGPAAFAWSAEV